jgi:peptidoglycan/LPS O-acetylase OafA/YrhL
MAASVDKDKPAEHDNSIRFDELDTIRGFCACAVTFNHFIFAFGDGYTQTPSIKGVAINFSIVSLLSVHIFFTISGHVIAFRYLQNGRPASLLSAAFRRIPRLIFPALWANLICWLLATHGAFAFEGAWRETRARITGSPDWCKDCFPKDLSVVLQSSFNLMLHLGVQHFLWLWTIPVELCGSAFVFIAAPLFRFIINFNMCDDGTNDFVQIAGQFWPQKLLRCLVAHGLVLAVMFAFGAMLEYCSDISGCQSTFGYVLWSASLWRYCFLFELGLATAQIRVVFAEASWGNLVLSQWNAEVLTKWLFPAGLAVFWLGCCTAKMETTLYFGPWLSIANTGSTFLVLGAAALFLSVLSSPKKVRDILRTFRFLGDISFSLYLVHHGVIWAIGMPIYVLLHRHFTPPPGVALSIIVFICIGPLYCISYVFWIAIEQPLGVWLPMKAFEGLTSWLLDPWKQKEKVPKASQSMREALTLTVSDSASDSTLTVSDPASSESDDS